MIRKAVIPAAGAGTRLYPATIHQPKEMLPIPVRGSDGNVQYRPILQVLFEQLYELGVREYCFVIGRSKRAIVDHFTPDYSSLNKLNDNKTPGIKEDVERFYQKLDNSEIYYAIQPKPRGFGDAVLMAEEFTKSENFWVIAGDTIIFSPNNPYRHFRRMMEVHERYKPAATISLEIIENPRNYGVVETEGVEEDVLKIKRAVEKPKEPPSNYAITALYIFNSAIFPALRSLRDKLRDSELQLTDGIDLLTRIGEYGVLLKKDEKRFDIGNPDLYHKACADLYELARSGYSVV
jgi:UTP--glucose-1-phosphate uridylyltransferase